MAPKKRTTSPPSSKTPNKTPKRADTRTSSIVASEAIATNADLQTLDLDSVLNQIQVMMPLPMREEECADGSLVFVGGDPGEVVIRVAQSRITVSVFGVQWAGPHKQGVRPHSLISLNWKLVPASGLKTILCEMIKTARKLRRAKYRKCERCGETKPPEWMHDTGGCQSCDQRSA